jgi:hypothetical protein
MTRVQKAIVAAGAASVAILCVLVVVALVVPSGQVANGNPDELVGRWKSENRYKGEVLLHLLPDGSFTEDMLHSTVLPDHGVSGKWTVVDGQLVLQPFLLLGERPPADGESEEYFYWMTDRWEIGVWMAKFGGAVFEPEEEGFSFTRER